MIDIKFKDCCYVCNYVDTYVNDNKLHAGGVVVHNTLVIGCEHDKVCKKFLESEIVNNEE